MAVRFIGGEGAVCEAAPRYVFKKKYTRERGDSEARIRTY